MAKTTLKSGTAKIKAAEMSIATQAKRKTKNDAKLASLKGKPDTSTKTKVSAKNIQPKNQSVKDLLSKQEKDVPDLNAGIGYPVHPDRIWPD